MIKAVAVENWLKQLPLAPKTRAHLRSLMHTIFNCAEGWELVDKNPIALVRTARPNCGIGPEFCRPDGSLGLEGDRADAEADSRPAKLPDREHEGPVTAF